MANNKNLSKAIRPILEKITCKIYAVFCIALVDMYNFTPEQAEELCEYSQALWMQSIDKNIDIFKWCEEVTGLDMKARVHEKENGNE